MNYVVYGNQPVLVKNRVKTIAKQILGDLNDMNYCSFDLSENLIQDIIDEAFYFPLGFDKKVVVLDNCYFLQSKGSKPKNDSNQNFDKLIKFLNIENENCSLIFVMYSLQFSAGDLSKIIKEKCELVKVEELDEKNWYGGVKDYCTKKYHLNIDEDAILELAKRTSGDTAALKNSLEKLSCYGEAISIKEIELLIPRKLEDNAFNIFTHLINHENDLALKTFRDLKINGGEPIQLVSMLATQFRLLNEVRYLSNVLGYNDNQISDELKITPIRAKMIKKNLYIINEAKITNTLEELFNLDYQIKNGDIIDRFYNFELFLINF